MLSYRKMTYFCPYLLSFIVVEGLVNFDVDYNDVVFFYSVYFFQLGWKYVRNIR